MLREWSGKLVCDDYSDYKANFAKGGTDIGCMAYARSKLVEQVACGKTLIAGQAVEYICQRYEIERETAHLSNNQHNRIRQRRAKPITGVLYRWVKGQRTKVPNGTATAKSLDFSLKRWALGGSYRSGQRAANIMSLIQSEAQLL